MNQALALRVRAFSSSIFLKALLALSGAGWFFFVLNHLYSNLHLFAGRESFNAYYAELGESPTVLWGIRGILLAGFVVHVGTSVVLTRRSVEALGPARYRMKKDAVTTYAARTMRWTGPIVGLYIVYHLLHLTVGAAMPPGLVRDPSDYYANVVGSFQVPWVAAIYVVANAALTVHLAHGLSSVFQSLGLTDPAYDRLRHGTAMAIGVVVCLGFISIPVAVWAGVLH
jgi:succinate dehydrogenase / fumarate reductase cytochrome b subunit